MSYHHRRAVRNLSTYRRDQILAKQRAFRQLVIDITIVTVLLGMYILVGTIEAL